MRMPDGPGFGYECAADQRKPEGLATSALKKAVVTLPEGMTVNPSAGAGLQACSEAEYEAEELESRAEGRAAQRVEARVGKDQDARR